MLNNMDIHQIKIQGIIYIDNEPSEDHEYSIALSHIQQKEGEVLRRRNDQGGYTNTYKMENLGTATLIREGEVIKGRAKKFSSSQLLRKIIEQEWEEQHSGEIDREAYYQKEMAQIIEERKNRLI